MTTNRPRYRQGVYAPPPRKKTWKQTLLEQSVACGIIAAVIFGINAIPAQPVKDAMQSVKSCLYYTVDYQATAMKLWNDIVTLPQKWNPTKKEPDTNESTDAAQPAA